jgi:hypothetical protein
MLVVLGEQIAVNPVTERKGLEILRAGERSSTKILFIQDLHFHCDSSLFFLYFFFNLLLYGLKTRKQLT